MGQATPPPANIYAGRGFGEGDYPAAGRTFLERGSDTDRRACSQLSRQSKQWRHAVGVAVPRPEPSATASPSNPWWLDRVKTSHFRVGSGHRPNRRTNHPHRTLPSLVNEVAAATRRERRSLD
jgi:hypothetical protein